jgi:hypothetical protein
VNPTALLEKPVRGEKRNNNTRDKVRKLQVKLYLSAKEKKTRRFHALYELKDI